jgi:hypothetical protein
MERRIYIQEGVCPDPHHNAMLRIDLSFSETLDDPHDFLSDQALSLARIIWRTI